MSDLTATPSRSDAPEPFDHASGIRRFLTEERSLPWHLQFFNYPPRPLSYLPAAQAALRAARQGDWERAIPLPDGQALTARRVVEELRLGLFLDGQTE